MSPEKERQSDTELSIAPQIKECALQLGFSKVGIARAGRLTEEHDRLQQWLTQGFHGEMKWMARDPAQRADPRRLFSKVRSVVVVALNYYTEHQHEVSATRDEVRTASGSERVERDEKAEVATGKISRYAW